MSDRWSVLHLQQNDLQLTLLPGIGGRLWDVNFQGRSLLFQNTDLDGLEVDDTQLTDLPTRSPQFGFPLWGGEKTWIAPDASWVNGAPFPVLDSGAYQITSRSSTHVDMTSAVCPTSRLSVSRRITLTSAESWDIEHIVANHGTSLRLTGIWSVMMLNTPAKIGVELVDPAHHPVFGSAEGMIATHGKGIVVDCNRQQEFKVRLPNPNGRTVARCGADGPLLMCSVPELQQGDQFAHDYPFEVFNSGDYAYCEAEWHSPARILAPNETLNFRQTFRVLAEEDASQMPLGLTNNKEFLSCMS
ncbi:hypothetical protein [Ruegeria atlantica]|uniref:DUF4380 domain-containing protein n=1 Tax=Ruegeria atlantica TaxID=81569 RepID=A0ABX1W7N6_9RHOB|nr:hypothetical protein [Ruegeria atlantica]NOD28939.1 hypothetical protein [Ruegeria atlantica]